MSVPDYDFLVEYTRFDMASCKGCQNKLIKDSLRIGKRVNQGTYFEVESAVFKGKDISWFHVECFFASGDQGLDNVAKLHGKDNIR